MNTEHKNKPATFFIVGNQRSGTTLLSVLFEKHPLVCMERKVLAFRIITCFKNLYELLPFNLRHDREAFTKWLIENDIEGRLKKFIDLENLPSYDNVRELLQGSIEKKLKAEGKIVWGDKAPNLQYYANDLLFLIPNAKFIHIVRDGRANAHSMSKRAYKNIALSAQNWVDGNTYGLVNQQLIGEDRYKIIHYENLLRQPEQEARAICAFLQIPFDENMLNLQDQQLQKEESYVKSFFDTSKIDKWKSQLSAKEIQTIENIQGSLLKELGYPLATPPEQLKLNYLSTRRQIFYHQKDNVKQLFRSKITGMVDKKLVKLRVPLRSRIYTFFKVIIQDVFSLKIFKSIFHRGYYSNKVYTGQAKTASKKTTNESD